MLARSYPATANSPGNELDVHPLFVAMELATEAALKAALKDVLEVRVCTSLSIVGAVEAIPAIGVGTTVAGCSNCDQSAHDLVRLFESFRTQTRVDVVVRHGGG